MDNKIIIAIDAMGGEKAPQKTIEGLSIFIEKNNKKSDFFFYLYGDEHLINVELKKNKISNNLIKVFHTTSTVSEEETPLTAIKNSKDSSMWKSINSQLN